MKEKVSWIIIVLITILSITTLTTLHDPIIHGGVAKLLGWDITDYDIQILYGYTNISTTQSTFQSTPTTSIWLFYMAPSLILLFGALLVVMMNPKIIVAVIAMVLMFLNFASLHPGLEGSDAYQASAFLISRDISPLFANTLHWGIFIAGMVAFGTMFYIMFENNPKDSEKRVKEIIRMPKKGKK